MSISEKVRIILTNPDKADQILENVIYCFHFHAVLSKNIVVT